ncbi:MAG: hypothetical protein ACXVZM_11510 [Terriglobales bacterium]
MTTPDCRRRAALVCLAAIASATWAAPSCAQSAKQLRKDYALIFGTVWDKQQRPVYGAVIKIRRESDKKPRWELVSDRSGEFAQRVPPGKMDYMVWVEDTRRVANPEVARRKRKPGEAQTKVHIEYDERADISLHLTE